MSIKIKPSLEERTLNRIIQTEGEGLEWDTAVFNALREAFAEARAPLVTVARMAIKAALQRPHDGNQLDEDLEGLLLLARDALAKAGVSE